MNYKIEFSNKAYKYYKKIDAPTRKRINNHLLILAEDPRHSELDIKKLKGYKVLIVFVSVIYVCYIQLRTMFLLSLYLKLVLVGMFIVFSKSHLHRKWLFLGSGRAGA